MSLRNARCNVEESYLIFVYVCTNFVTRYLVLATLINHYSFLLCDVSEFFSSSHPFATQMLLNVPVFVFFFFLI